MNGLPKPHGSFVAPALRLVSVSELTQTLTSKLTALESVAGSQGIPSAHIRTCHVPRIQP